MLLGSEMLLGSVKSSNHKIEIRLVSVLERGPQHPLITHFVYEIWLSG